MSDLLKYSGTDRNKHEIDVLVGEREREREREREIGREEIGQKGVKGARAMAIN